MDDREMKGKLFKGSRFSHITLLVSCSADCLESNFLEEGPFWAAKRTELKGGFLRT